MRFYCTVLASILAVGKVFRRTRQKVLHVSLNEFRLVRGTSQLFGVLDIPNKKELGVIQLGRGTPEVASGEPHLWVRHCKVSNLSGFAEGRIPIRLMVGSVKKTVSAEKTPATD
jgi:hypothetical protein